MCKYVSKNKYFTEHVVLLGPSYKVAYSFWLCICMKCLSSYLCSIFCSRSQVWLSNECDRVAILPVITQATLCMAITPTIYHSYRCCTQHKHCTDHLQHRQSAHYRNCTYYSQHRCYSQHGCYCGSGNCSSNYWHYCICCWSPGWGSAVPLYQQTLVTTQKASRSRLVQ